MAGKRLLYVRPSAEAEIAGAVSWYRGKHAGLEIEFLTELERAFAEIRSAPDRWPLWRADRLYRKRPLRRFPFIVLYRVATEYVRVAAVAHTSRRPGYWIGP